MTLKSNYRFYLTSKLDSTDSSVTISNDVETNTAVSLSTATSLVIQNTDGTEIERVVGTASGGTLTLTLRGLDNTSTKTEDSDLKKDWRPGALVFVTQLASDTLDTDSDNTFTGDQTFEGNVDMGTTVTTKYGVKLKSLTTAQRDALSSPPDGVAIYNSTTSQINYREGGAWVANASGGSVANATDAVAGKSEIATSAESQAGTDTGGTGASVFVLPSDIAANDQAGRFRYAGTATAVYIPGYLTGGSNAQSTAATWAAVTDGSFRITVDGTAYNVDAINFTGDADMDDVASTIQTALRTATSGTETVVWDTDHFVITSGDTTSSSAVTVTTTSTGTVGTDISGAGGSDWMDCDTGNGTVTAAVQDKFTATMTPTLTAYTTGMGVTAKAPEANVGGLDFNIDGLGDKAFKMIDGDDPVAGEIAANQFIYAIYDGTNFVVQNPPALASDSEVSTGTDIKKYITPKQAKDNYGFSYADSLTETTETLSTSTATTTDGTSRSVAATSSLHVFMSVSQGSYAGTRTARFQVSDDDISRTTVKSLSVTYSSGGAVSDEITFIFFIAGSRYYRLQEAYSGSTGGGSSVLTITEQAIK